MTSAIDLGIVGDGETDCAPAFAEAMEDADVTDIEFGPGDYVFGSQVELRSGISIRGCGPSTRFSPLPTFAPRTHLQNALLSTAPDSQLVRVSDLTLDGMDVGMSGGSGDRIHGLVTKRTLGFLIERVVSTNWSGYAFWTTGLDQVDGDRHCSGTYVDCRASNSNVLFEQTACSGVWLLRCHGDDGRRTVGNCEAAFHPWLGAENVTFEDCGYVGAAGSGATVLSFGEMAMAGIVFRRCRIRMTGATTALVAGWHQSVDQPFRIELTVEDCDIASALGSCASLKNVDGTFRRTSLTGYSVCTGLDDGADILFEDTNLLASNDPAVIQIAHALRLEAGSAATVVRGSLRARGYTPIAYIKNPAATLTLAAAPNQPVLEPPL
jgi:hypothetical protein